MPSIPSMKFQMLMSANAASAPNSDTHTGQPCKRPAASRQAEARACVPRRNLTDRGR